jgi:hypothetical protein
MLLGDIIARLEDDAAADEALLSLGDLSLTARVAEAASREGLTRGEYVAASVGQYAANASDEEWVTVLGQMGRVQDPGRILLRRAVAVALDVTTA